MMNNIKLSLALFSVLVVSLALSSTVNAVESPTFTFTTQEFYIFGEYMKIYMTTNDKSLSSDTYKIYVRHEGGVYNYPGTMTKINSNTWYFAMFVNPDEKRVPAGNWEIGDVLKNNLPIPNKIISGGNFTIVTGDIRPVPGFTMTTDKTEYILEDIMKLNITSLENARLTPVFYNEQKIGASAPLISLGNGTYTVSLIDADKRFRTSSIFGNTTFFLIDTVNQITIQKDIFIDPNHRETFELSISDYSGFYGGTITIKGDVSQIIENTQLLIRLQNPDDPIPSKHLDINCPINIDRKFACKVKLTEENFPVDGKWSGQIHWEEAQPQRISITVDIVPLPIYEQVQIVKADMEHVHFTQHSFEKEISDLRGSIFKFKQDKVILERELKQLHTTVEELSVEIGQLQQDVKDLKKGKP